MQAKARGHHRYKPRGYRRSPMVYQSGAMKLDDGDRHGNSRRGTQKLGLKVSISRTRSGKQGERAISDAAIPLNHLDQHLTAH